MSYVLGAEAEAPKTPTGVAYVLTPTAEKDGFASLFRAYAAAYPAGTTTVAFARDLCRANGIVYGTPTIEAWIESKGGGRYPFVAGNNPGMYGGPKNVGWGFFREGNQILLPAIPRADGKPGQRAPAPAPGAPPAPKAPEGGELQAASASTNWWLVAGFAGLVVLALAFANAERKKKAPRAAAT